MKQHTAILEKKISFLRIQKKRELAELKQQFSILRESTTPSHLIKEGIRQVYNPITHKFAFANTILSALGGYLSKKIVVGKTHSTIKRIFGNLLQISVSKLISNNIQE